jgi:hypothetical protein
MPCIENNLKGASMSDVKTNYGLLISKDIKLHRTWFKQMVALHGINCKYRAPIKNKEYDVHGDLQTGYKPEILVGCIFVEHPDQKSLKKAGWVAELQEGSSIIHVPYDLPDLQVGALFDVPSGLDTGKDRTFRVISMSNIMIYPASIACEIALEYESNDEQHLITAAHEKEDMPLLIDREDDD